jgi:hypothetical protein
MALSLHTCPHFVRTRLKDSSCMFYVALRMNDKNHGQIIGEPKIKQYRRRSIPGAAHLMVSLISMSMRHMILI